MQLLIMFFLFIVGFVFLARAKARLLGRQVYGRRAQAAAIILIMVLPTSLFFSLGVRYLFDTPTMGVEEAQQTQDVVILAEWLMILFGVVIAQFILYWGTLESEFDPYPDVMSLEVAAQYLNLSPDFLEEMIVQKRLHAFQNEAGEYRLTRSALNQFIPPHVYEE
ncbi:hypothetical protein MASR2M15_21070 [Anaerolineales bacterium]